MQQAVRFVFILIILGLLSACAASYKAADEGVSGYRDLQVDKNVYYVEYTEGARVPWESIHQFVLKRCAEITKQRGYKFFDVLSKDEKTVYLESDINQISIATMGNLAVNPPVTNTYNTGGRVEGRRVTFKIQLLNE